MKAQADILSAVLIVIMSIGLVSTAYTWGVPLIQKRQDTSMIERTYKYFARDNPSSLTRKIENIAKYGGEDTFTVDLAGMFQKANWRWVLYPCTSESEVCSCTDEACKSENNTIQLTVASKVSNVAVDYGWIPSICGGLPGIISTQPSFVCGKAVKGDDMIEVTYKTWFRELDEDPTDPSTRGYKIVLYSPSGIIASTGSTLRISRGSIREKIINGKTLIITEIKILFI